MSFAHKYTPVVTFVDKWNKENSDLNEARQRCLHKSCTKCNGTGHTKTGEACIHMISCPCPSCSPYYL